MRRVDNGAAKHDAGERINELAGTGVNAGGMAWAASIIVPNAVQTQCRPRIVPARWRTGHYYRRALPEVDASLFDENLVPNHGARPRNRGGVSGNLPGEEALSLSVHLKSRKTTL